MIGGFDLSGYPVDGPLPDIPETNGGKSRQQLLIDLARRDNLTIRQLYLRIAGARGHQQVVGTPQSVADQLQQWFEEDGADGFNIMSPVSYTHLDVYKRQQQCDPAPEHRRGRAQPAGRLRLPVAQMGPGLSLIHI